MNYIKRAIQSLWAKKGRSIIMIAVFSAILIFVLAGLTIRSGAELATTNAKKSVGATVTLSTNREEMFGQRSESDTDSDEESSRPDPGSFERTPVNLSDAKKSPSFRMLNLIPLKPALPLTRVRESPQSQAIVTVRKKLMSRPLDSADKEHQAG